MTLTPLADAGMIIQIHVFAAIAAVLIGPVALLRGRRDGWHRLAGGIWVVLMVLVAASGLLISERPVWGPFSPIHLFSVITFAGLVGALRAAWARDFIRHGRIMRALYAQALIIPGVFTLLPGRRLQAVIDAEAGMVPFALAAALAVAVMAGIWFHPALRRALDAGRKNPLFFMRANR